MRRAEIARDVARTLVIAAIRRGVALAFPPAFALAALFFAATGTAEAQADSLAAWPVIARVRIDGLASDDAARAEAAWRSIAGRRANPEEIARAADQTLARLAAAGHLDARCSIALVPDAGDSTSALLAVTYDAGGLVPIDSAAVEGARALSADAARERLRVRGGEPFDPERFARGADDLLVAYERAGYPFARLVPRDFTRGPGLTFRLTVDEGPHALLAGLAVTGNKGTRESYIAREMLLHPGTAWNPRALERGRARLLRTGLFRSVGTPYPLVDESGAVRVGLVVEEAPANRIEGVFGFNQGEGGEDGFFSGYLDLLLRNLGGSGRRVSVRWERRTEDARELRFGYREPWVFTLPLGIGFDLSRTFRDSTYAQTAVTGLLEMPVSAELSLSARGAYDSWSPGDREPAVVPNSRRTSVGAGVRWTATDEPTNPGRGVNIDLAADYGSKEIDEVTPAVGDSIPRVVRKSTIEEWIGRAAGELFVPLSGPHTLRLSAFGNAIWSDERPVPEYERFFLGGARSLRGYDEDRFLGDRVGVITAEYRFRLGGRSRLFLFVDQGFVSFEQVEPGGGVVRTDLTPLGWGGGLQADSRVGIMGIGVGIPEGEGLSSARVHVSVAQEF